MMRSWFALAALALGVGAPVQASHCFDPAYGCDGNACAGLVMVGDSPDRTYYVDDRNFVLGNGLWLYEESNGIWVAGDALASLQRGGCSDLVPDDCDASPCPVPIGYVPDRLIY